jgi:ABC-type molybdate transport system ATPase subunit
VALFFCDRAGFKCSAVYVCIRAEDVLLEQAGSGVTSAHNHLSGLVTDMLPQGRLVKVTVDCGFPCRR